MNRFVVLLAAVLGAAPAIARADAHVEYRLHYQADAACPGADRFAAEVAARLGFVPWSDVPVETLVVAIVADDPGFRGELRRADGAHKVLRAATCSTLVAALASAAAVAIDPGLHPGAPLVVSAPDVVADGPRFERRWAPRTPLYVTGAGLATGAVGGLFWMLARANMDRFNAQIASQCAAGCDPQRPEVSSAYSYKGRAEWQNKVGLVALGAGAVTTLAGITMAFLNGPRLVESPRIAVTPTEDGVGVSVAGAF
ncbi:MAG: hypothetical protein R2939_15500 [Kofleriaceae bacterium]